MAEYDARALRQAPDDSKDSWWTGNFEQNVAAAQARMRVEKRSAAVEAYLASVESLDERENCGHPTQRTIEGRSEWELAKHHRL